MKKYLILIIILIQVYYSWAQNPGWTWASSAGGTNKDYGNCIATDANGNVYVAGAFSSADITFGINTLVNDSINTTDIFLVKFSPSGNVLWAKSSGGAYSDECNSICIDSSGSVYITGYFRSSTITFGTYNLTNANAGKQDIFLVKYDSLGNVLWAKREGCNYSYDEIGQSICSDNDGNIFLTGLFSGPSITFGTFGLSNPNLGEAAIFLVKYNSTGNVLWAKKGIGICSSVTVSTDKGGNAFIVGTFISVDIKFGGYTLTNSGWADIFFVRYNSAGNVIWAKSTGGTEEENGNSVCTDSYGNVYITGTFYSPSISFDGFSLTKTGFSNIFLVKYDTIGNVQWAKKAGVSLENRGISVCTDVVGNIYLTGYFWSNTLSFGSYILTNSGNNSCDLYLAKYDSSGNVLWAKSAKGDEDDYGKSVCIGTPDNVYITGDYLSSNIIFDSDSLANSGEFYNDIFIAKLNTITNYNVFINEEDFFSIFPNPSNYLLVINNLDYKNDNVKIFSIDGKIIQNCTIKNNTIDISSLPNGIFQIKLMIKDKFITKKFIKID